MGNESSVDGVRRRFQPRAELANNSHERSRNDLDDANRNNNRCDNNNSNKIRKGQVPLISESSGQRKNNKNHSSSSQKEFSFQIDFDISGLKLIKVANRVHNSHHPSMDPHKKKRQNYLCLLNNGHGCGNGREIAETLCNSCVTDHNVNFILDILGVMPIDQLYRLLIKHFSSISDPSLHKGISRIDKNVLEKEFFTEYGEASRYQVQEIIGKGSYGVVGSAVDTHTGEKVAIKKINDVFEHVSDATRILREIKLLRLLRHPDIVEIKHIMLPPSRREFRDIYVVFELMESDLHQVIKANDDLTPEHYQFFLYQLLRGLKYIHTANVFHRDLKPKNILANADCKLKICDFGLARVSFNDAPSAIFWTDYVATRWYRAPELCGSFFSKYTPAIDIWSIGCIFAEMLTGKPLFPGKNVVHQLDLMTDLLGTPSPEAISRIRNEKARRYLSSMRKKPPIPFTQKFPSVDPMALRLLERLLAFDPKDRPTAEEALADPYFNGLANVDREPSTTPISKLEFEFERRKLTKDDVRELIYREILEYHPQMLQEYLRGQDQTSFMYPSGVDRFKRQFAHLEEHFGKGEKSSPLQRQHASLPRERVPAPKDDNANENNEIEKGTIARTALESPPRTNADGSENELAQNGINKPNYSARSLLKSASISASKCIGVQSRKEPDEEPIAEHNDEVVDGAAQKVTVYA